MEEINLQPIGGLCNRLRVLLSYKYKYPNKKINVYWIVKPTCPGFFLDYFEPIENVEFFHSIPTNVKILPEFKTCSSCYNILSSKKKEDFSNLVFNQGLQDKINKIIKDNFNDKYISCHIRRTDHIKAFGKGTKTTVDDDFINFLKNNEGNIYIATDNLDTQKIFYEKFKERIPYIKFIEKSDKLRQTSIEDSIIDLYICASSNKFMGTYWSSYSNFISKLKYCIDNK